MQGKSHSLPFSSSDRQSSRLLELVHCDIWVPSPIPLCSGFLFFVIFVDDYSRYTWLYPLVNKSEVVSCFISFQARVEKQFSTKIQSF